MGRPPTLADSVHTERTPPHGPPAARIGAGGRSSRRGDAPHAAGADPAPRRGSSAPAAGTAPPSGGRFTHRRRTGTVMEDAPPAAEIAAAADRTAWWDRLLEQQRTAWHTERELASAVLGTLVAASVMVGASIHGTLFDTEVDAL